MKNKLFTVAFLSVVVALFSACGNQSGKENKATEEKADVAKLGQFVGAGTENPSLYFYIQASEETDTTITYTAKSLHDKDTVGVQIQVSKNIPAGIASDGNPDNEEGFKEGIIRFVSLGAQSDAFVKALGAVYQRPVTGGMSTTAIVPLVFSSNKQAVDLSKNGTYSFKLFFANHAGAEAEVFAILDLYRRVFELKAKDATHYERIVAAFEGR